MVPVTIRKVEPLEEFAAKPVRAASQDVNRRGGGIGSKVGADGGQIDVDTRWIHCHLFAVGYPIHTAEGYGQTFEEFDLLETEQEAQHGPARYALTDAAGIALRNALTILGITSPD